MMFVATSRGVIPVDKDTVLIECPDDMLLPPLNWADDPRCAVIPLLENLRYEETPDVTLPRDLIETMVERLEQIDDPDDTLMETEFLVDGVRVRIV